MEPFGRLLFFCKSSRTPRRPRESLRPPEIFRTSDIIPLKNKAGYAQPAECHRWACSRDQTSIRPQILPLKASKILSFTVRAGLPFVKHRFISSSVATRPEARQAKRTLRCQGVFRAHITLAARQCVARSRDLPWALPSSFLGPFWAGNGLFVMHSCYALPVCQASAGNGFVGIRTLESNVASPAVCLMCFQCVYEATVFVSFPSPCSVRV